jgi:N-acetylneuraminic acid mutarotase
MMKQFAVYAAALLIVVTPVFLVPGCSKSTDGDDDLIGNWLRSYDFDGNARSEAVSFNIGDKAYIATGQNDRDRFADIWEFDLDKKYWLRRADMPAAAGVRSSAVGFALNGLGYVATGFDGTNKLKDVWQFDPVANVWTPKNPFPGTARYDAIAFTIGANAYISCGYDDNFLKDLWKYNPTNDSWEQKASLSGTKRTAATVFVLNNLAYVISGNNNGTALNDLWVYDPATDIWTEKRKLTNVSDEDYDDDYSGINRYNAVSFIMGGKAYLTTGENGSLSSTTWEYDVATDLWKQKTGFSGSARTGAIATTLKDRGFVIAGRSGSLAFDNAYEFQPTVEDNDDDN